MTVGIEKSCVLAYSRLVGGKERILYAQIVEAVDAWLAPHLLRMTRNIEFSGPWPHQRGMTLFSLPNLSRLCEWLCGSVNNGLKTHIE